MSTRFFTRPPPPCCNVQRGLPVGLLWRARVVKHQAVDVGPGLLDQKPDHIGFAHKSFKKINKYLKPDDGIVSPPSRHVQRRGPPPSLPGRRIQVAVEAQTAGLKQDISPSFLQII